VSPVRRAALIWAAALALTVGGGVIAKLLLPDASGTIRALLVTQLLFVAILIARARWWTWAEVGVNRPRTWRRLHLLVLPAILAVSPLALGVEPTPAGTVALLATGYALTGFNEEVLWRGMVQGVLAPTGVVRSVVVAAALFGSAHLANVLFRDSVGLVLAQAWGAFCFGLAYGALRNRINTVVPLMVLHAVTDMAAAVGALPKIPTLVVEDVVLLALGIVLLVQDHRAARPGPDPQATTSLDDGQTYNKGASG
jgi:hypothetical protein